jgi:hypothetical protein
MALRKGGSRRGVGRTAIVSVVALASFQVLAIIGAGSALASGTCAYDLATQRVNISIDSGTGSTLQVSDGTVAGTAAGDLLFDGAPCGGSPNITNTASVNVTTAVSNTAEAFTIDNTFGAPDREFSTTIAWFVDLGQGAGDILSVVGADQTDNVYVFANTSFTLNGAAGTTAGLEVIQAIGFGGDDTLDGSALTNAVQFIGVGQGGDDWIAPGASGVAPTVGDTAVGGAGFDTLSYGTRTTSTFVNNGVTAGLDANADGDNADPGDEVDVIDCFEVVVTGTGNDNIIATCGPTTAVPGDGDDNITGNGDDWIDWSSSSAGMVIDIPNATATGQGTDEWTGVTRFVGSAFDDTMLVTGSAPGATVAEFFGGAGVDTVDGSAATAGLFINLDILDPSGADDLENVIGSEFTDSLHGNDLRNEINALGGDDLLDGQPGNDVLTGGPGNDSFSGGSGADKISYATNTTAGIEADMNLGFVTSSDSGDDGLIAPDIEIVQGSPFNDSITGGGGLTTVNFLFAGGNGKDTLTGSGSNDTLKGGAGNDRLRGLEGGDTLKGGKGSNDKGWGGPGVDFCTGVEVERGCE